MSSRPVVSVYNSDSAKESGEGVPMPAVFSTPIRNDLVHYVHSQLSKNRRQGHAVFYKAGAEHSAESWGTGRAVARIPRISGSGTSRSGQATFGNMCRKARMFAPLKIWRKWHAKANITQRRHAVASALAASACTPLVMARGHHVGAVPELPLVVDKMSAANSKSLLQVLNTFGAGEELAKVRRSKKIRAGVGKYRNSRYVMKKGPLVIYGDESKDVKRAARNLPGVDACNVSRLNILQLAPGGHLGRFVIFTKDAFKSLDNIFGSFRHAGVQKTGYHLARSVMTCADLSRIINSDQVQAKLREVRHTVVDHHKKKNPLTNKTEMQRINPFDKKKRELQAKLIADRQAAKKKVMKEKRSKAGKAAKAKRNGTYKALQAGLVASFQKAQDVLDAEARAGNYVPGDTTEEEDED